MSHPLSGFLQVTAWSSSLGLLCVSGRLPYWAVEPITTLPALSTSARCALGGRVMMSQHMDGDGGGADGDDDDVHYRQNGNDNDHHHEAASAAATEGDASDAGADAMQKLLMTMIPFP